LQVLVDTSIWSLALGRRNSHLSKGEAEQIASLRELILDGRARLFGPVRQELLSGIREKSRFENLRNQLRAFPEEALTQAEYETAAFWSNECRRRGVAGSSVDFLICSLAIARHWQVFTSDADFRRYAEIIPLQLFTPS
jgi:hypothetical protein